MTTEPDASDSNSINTEEAKVCIDNFRKLHPGKSGSFLFGKDLVIRILGQDDAVGFKIYLGCDCQNSFQLIMVGTREDGSEIWPSINDESKPQVGRGQPCG